MNKSNIKYLINGIPYRTKGQVFAEAKRIVYQYADPSERSRQFVPFPVRLCDIDGDWLRAMFESMRPNKWEEKSLGIFDHFNVVVEPVAGGYDSAGYAKRGLQLVRLDGTRDNLSYRQGPDHENWKQELNNTLRSVVHYFIAEERDRLYRQTDTCAETGVALEDCLSVHVDHDGVPFCDIVRDWLELRSITPGPGLFSEKVDGQRIRELASQEMAADFYSFHESYVVDGRCTLQLVEATANMKKGAKRAIHLTDTIPF